MAGDSWRPPKKIYGIGSVQECRIGQAVVVLHGAKTPYLLQRAGSRGYGFVGECYVHGLVHGAKHLPSRSRNRSLQFGRGVYDLDDLNPRTMKVSG